MKKAHLVALSTGVGKTGKKWFRAVLKTRVDGAPIVSDFWLTESVGTEAVRQGLTDSVDVIIETGMDEFLRLQITAIKPAYEFEEEETL